MIITILAMGSRGDVQPFLALAQGLHRAGFTVRMAAHANFQPFVESYGIEFYRIGEEDIQKMMQDPATKKLLQQKSPLKTLTGMRDLLSPHMVEAMQDMTIALDGADLAIVGGMAIYGGMDACLQANVPMIASALQPIIENTQVQSSMFPIYPDKMVGKRIYNYVTHILFMQGFWQIMRPVINHGRAEVWGAEKAPFLGHWNKKKKTQGWLMLGYSPTMLPPLPEWPENVIVTGYWFLDEADEWIPPQYLLDFLDAGEPPIYIGFGSMTNEDPLEATHRAIDALVASGERGVLLTGWGGMEEVELPDNIITIDSCPHSWLFPKMKAIVHHGGAGTTSASLRAGKPQIITPFFADQPFWGDLMHKQGVATKPIRNTSNTAEQLTRAIQVVSQDLVMQRTADELGQKIRAEDGVATAVEFVKNVLKNL